jgi:hypothetical protein
MNDYSGIEDGTTKWDGKGSGGKAGRIKPNLSLRAQAI